MELARIKEAEGDIASAASTLQELQVIVHCTHTHTHQFFLSPCVELETETILQVHMCTVFQEAVPLHLTYIQYIFIVYSMYVCIFVMMWVISVMSQVETFGSMEREEKVQFILEQMRLGLARKDYIRTQIISKKISVKFFSSSTDSDVVQVSEREGCVGLV